VFAGSLLLSFVVAYVIGLKEGVTRMGAVGIGCLLWLGLSAVQWVSSMVWEKVPLTMAAIHAGDWLMKLLVTSAMLGLGPGKRLPSGCPQPPAVRPFLMDCQLAHQIPGQGYAVR